MSDHPLSPPPLGRALRVGSLWHFLLAFVGPVAVASSAAALTSGSLESDLFRVTFLMTAVVSGALFLWNELVIAVAALSRRRKGPRPDDVPPSSDLLMAAITADIAAVGLVAAGVLAFDGPTRGWGPLLVLFLPAWYGVWRMALVVGPAVGPEPPRRARPWGLQVYMMTAVAVPAFAAVGFDRGIGVTFAVALVAAAFGRAAVWLATPRT